jgi:hypothetical protein
MVETPDVRSVTPAPNSVFFYGLPSFAFSSFYFLPYLLRGFRFSFQRLVLGQRLRPGVGREKSFLVVIRKEKYRWN